MARLYERFITRTADVICVRYLVAQQLLRTFIHCIPLADAHSYLVTLWWFRWIRVTSSCCQADAESHGRVSDNQHPTASSGDICSQYGATQPPNDYYNHDHGLSLQTTTNTAVAVAGNRQK